VSHPIARVARTGVYLIALPLIGGPARLTSHTAQPAILAKAEVVRIQARQCAGAEKSRVGTGFVWRSSNEIVTALHVVAGCTSIQAYSERDRVTYPLTMMRALPRADLALMQLGDNGSFPFLSVVPAHPTTADDLIAWGYGEGIPAMRSFTMHVADGGRTLRDNVPSDVARALVAVGTPSLDIDVVPIQDVTPPGLSGAPILDAAGRVRAIADGGVKHGITRVGWAIPAKYLTELANSSEVASSYVAPNAHLSGIEESRAELYAADFVDTDAPRIKCGSAELRMVRTMPFSEVAPATDSPAGLYQLLGAFGGQPPPDFNLDVWEDASSGATVAMPQGTRLTNQGNSCRATALGGQLEMRVQVTQIPPFSNPNAVSAQFEGIAATPPMQSWITDPNFTYFMPFYRPDGLVVTRKAFARSYPANALGLPTDYFFETLAVRHGTFLGVAAMRHNDVNFALCMRGAPGVQCPPANYMLAWAQAALSVHLSTFGISAARQGGLVAWQQRDGGDNR
jgi:hypothetical protein